MDSVLHDKLNNLYRGCLRIGGLSEIVEDYVSRAGNILNINRKITENIIESYILDMNKYVKNKFEATKNEVVYKSVPVQIGNTSNKFKYSKIEKDARKRDYESSLDWLLSSSLIYKCCKLDSINIPPEAYKNIDYFKIYMGDVGILNTMLKININENENDIYLDKMFLYKEEIAKKIMLQTN